MKVIFDYDNSHFIKPYTTTKNGILCYTFHKNMLNYSLIKKISKSDFEIYCTKNFKNNSPYKKTHFKNYDFSKNTTFKTLIYNNIDIIFKSISNQIKTLCIYCQNPDERAKNITDCAIKHSDIIYFQTNDSNFFDKMNTYAIKTHGIGLLRSVSKECDVIVILNTKITDFYKKGKYIINLQENNTVFNCNLLWDFCDEKTSDFDTKGIKKAFFIEKTPVFLKLKWKILKKS